MFALFYFNCTCIVHRAIISSYYDTHLVPCHVWLIQRDHVLVRVEEDFEDCDQSDLGSVTREEAGNGHCCHDEPDTSVLSD